MKNTETQTGKIKFFNAAKGFGFLTTGNGDVFFHIKNCKSQADSLKKEADVEFTIGENKQGPQAENVTVV